MNVLFLSMHIHLDNELLYGLGISNNRCSVVPTIASPHRMSEPETIFSIRQML